jgi:hypothetical protein
MTTVNLFLSMPQGTCTATTLDLDGFARHRSPGSGQVFQGRAIYIDLPVENGKAAFKYYDEGGWRDAAADTEMAVAACANKRTKTALSNNAFSIVPIDSYRGVSLIKTGGHHLPLESAGELFHFNNHEWKAFMTPDDVAQAAGLPKPAHRRPRCYLVFGPVEFIMLSNLTPEEYVWYATHRPGKIFRNVMFTEIDLDPRMIVAEKSYESARDELANNPSKKTKIVYHGGAYDRVPFKSWVGMDGKHQGGLYTGDKNRVMIWKLPAKLPSAWVRADG